MSALTRIAEPAVNWFAEQQDAGRDLFLIVDRLAEPDPIPELFHADVMDEYINLYSGTEWDELADIGPWLIKMPAQQSIALSHLWEAPERNWGWLASASQLSLVDLARHWRERLLIEGPSGKALYRFQDNRVIAHHLSALSVTQIPLLLGPLDSALCWAGDAWLITENAAPAHHVAAQGQPWLDVPEPPEVARNIQRKNACDWLWAEHPQATTRLASARPLMEWLDSQLETASKWGWGQSEQLEFLLTHQLDSDLAQSSFWTAREGETPDQHYQRCRQAVVDLLRHTS